MKNNFLQYLPVILLAWMFFAQLSIGSLELSMTSDEPPHLISGYVMLTTGDPWGIPIHGHPPLVNAWSAWPILLQPERPDSRAVTAWHQDWIRFVRAMWPLLGPIDRLAFITRVPIMLLGVTLMAVVYRWASDWFGHWGGVLAAAVMAWDPNMIAYSQLNTTDLGLTLFTFACLYLISRLLRRFRRASSPWRLLAGVGLLLGAAMAAKPSGLMLAPVVVAMFGWGYIRETSVQWWTWLRGPRRSPDHLRRLIRATGRWMSYSVLAILIGGLALWACYRFEWSALKGTSVSLPLATHIRMLDILIRQKGRLAFLWGEIRPGGWWWYFPFAFAVKSPIPYLIGVGAALLLTARKWRTIGDEMTLWFFPVVYWAIAIQSGLNIGYRHLLPTLPFAYVGLARLGQWMFAPLSRWRLIARWATAALGVWYVVGAVQVYPFALAYFNEFIGGPQNGYRYLVDSNVDWGQSFKALKSYMDKAEVQSVRLSYYTLIDPAVYGIRYEPLFPAPKTQPAIPRRFNPEPGVYAISASTLWGIMSLDPDLYGWFQHHEPTTQPGYGLLVYNVRQPATPRAWVAQCTVPVTPLEPDQIAEGFGQSDLRVVGFDCATSWLYPTGDKSPGWFALSRDAPAWTQRYLGVMRLSYEQKRAGFSPPFRIYEDEGRAAWPQGGQAHIAPSALALREAVATPPLELPVTFDSLTLLGYTLDRSALKPGETALLETVWRVESVPVRLLSVMAQALGSDGHVVVQGDGLGVPIESWQPGDVFTQRHLLTLPKTISPGAYWIQIGVYWLDNGERWPARDQRATGDRALLLALKVNP